MKSFRASLAGLAVATGLALGACGDDDGAAAAAPASLAGQTYDLTIASGSGVFASTGTFSVAFSSTDEERYLSTGDQTNVGDSAGTYRYSADGNLGIVTFDDASIGAGRYELTFDGPAAGGFVAVVDIDPEASQRGTFTVR